MGLDSGVNTVVDKYNVEEDMRAAIAEIGPFRWKCAQVLVVEWENDAEATLRDARRFVVSDEQFGRFCAVHGECGGFVAEPDGGVRDSCLLLDESVP